MSLDNWFAFMAAALLASATPGPVMLLALSNGARYSRRQTLIGIVGSSAGHALLMALSALGLGVLLYASESLFALVKWVAAAYLIILGLRLCIAVPVDRSHDIAQTTSVGSAVADQRRRGIFMQAFMVAAANPKGLLFFGALFPLFINPQGPRVLQFTVLAMSFLAIDCLWQWTYAASGRRLLSWLDTPKRRRGFHCGQGMAFVAMGAVMATMKRN